MARSRPAPEQIELALPAVQPAPERDPVVINLRNKRVGAFVGEIDGANRARLVFVQLCDRCHEPGICLKGRWYHEMPCKHSCRLDDAPRPSFAAMERLRRWYEWAKAEARAETNDAGIRRDTLEEITEPLELAELEELSDKDRKYLPTVKQAKGLEAAMKRTVLFSGVEPVEMGQWRERKFS